MNYTYDASRAKSQTSELKSAAADSVRTLEIPDRLSSLRYELDELQGSINILSDRLDSAGIMSARQVCEESLPKEPSHVTPLGEGIYMVTCRIHAIREFVQSLTTRMEI